MNPFLYMLHMCAGMILCMPSQEALSQTKDIFVDKVTNRVQIGALAGNRNLEFGVKNVLEELLLDKDYSLVPTATHKLRVEIVYLDVLTTKKNISVFHQNAETVVIRLLGVIVNTDGKVLKKAMAEESSSEISMSTLIIDQMGKFNQTSLSIALKKASETLINKLTN